MMKLHKNKVGLDKVKLWKLGLTFTYFVIEKMKATDTKYTLILYSYQTLS